MVPRGSSRAANSNNGRIHAILNQQGRATRPWTRLIAEVPRSATALYTRQRIHKEHRGRHTTGSTQHWEIRGGVHTARQEGNRERPPSREVRGGSLAGTQAVGCTAGNVSQGCHWTGLSWTVVRAEGSMSTAPLHLVTPLSGMCIRPALLSVESVDTEDSSVSAPERSSKPGSASASAQHRLPVRRP